MRALLSVTCICSVLLATLAAPLAGDTEIDPELSGDFFEGDIEYDIGRNGLIAPAMHWPNGIAHYTIDEAFDRSRATYIRRALDMIEEVSCIRFIPATETTKNRLHFIAEPTGCHTKVGYRGGVHTINLQLDALDKGCFRLGTIMHETLHALGFYHQQSAAERDDYVKIVLENIQPGKEHNFNKYDGSVVSDFGVDYDYESVMHYSATAFSRNGQPTIVPLRDTKAVMGQRRSMTKADIARLNVMYKCPIYN